MATPAIPPEPAPQVSSVGRISGAIFSPPTTFESIAQRPTWILPLLLISLLSIVTVFIFGQRVGWRGFMIRQDQQNSRLQKQMDQMTPEQRDKMLDQQTKIAPIFGYVGAVLGIFVAAVIVAAVLMVVFNMMTGGGIRFMTSLGIVAHSWVPALIGGLLGILVLFLKDPSTVDIQHLVATNAGALLSDDAPKWQEALLSSFDLFTFWSMILMGIGYSAANPKKISFGKALGTIVVVWAIYVVCKVGLSAAFS
jgi:membrane protein, antimicrobial resistance system